MHSIMNRFNELEHVNQQRLFFIKENEPIRLKELSIEYKCSTASMSEWIRNRVEQGLLCWCDKNGNDFFDDAVLRKSKHCGDAYLRFITEKPKKQYKKSKKIIKAFYKDRDNPNKKFIENLFLNEAFKYLKNVPCLVITGPDYTRHVSSLFNTIASRIYIAEIDNEISGHLWTQAQSCKYFQKGLVYLLHTDVSKVVIPECLFIDLDLMCLLKNMQHIIPYHLSTQSRNTSDYKGFAFTSTLRWNKNNNLYTGLSNLLADTLGYKILGFDDKIKGFGKGNFINLDHKKDLKYCQQHMPIVKEKGRVDKAIFFTYCDHTPMFTCLILYK